VIEKMRFLSITGPKEDIDRVIEEYLSKYDIQLENALSELKNVRDLYPYIDSNPYKETYLLSEDIKHNFKDTKLDKMLDLSVREAADTVNALYADIKKLQEQKEEIEAKKADYKDRLSKVEQFIGLNYDLGTVLHFKFIKYRFGRISREYYDKLSAYMVDDIDSVFCKCQEIDDYIWGVYFVPESVRKKVDAIYSSLHFERFFLPEGYQGTPREASNALKEEIAKCEAQIEEIASQIASILESRKTEFLTANKRLKLFADNFEIRKLAACTKASQKVFYILCGWLREKDALALSKAMEKDESAFCILEKDHSNLLSSPPTKLKNNALFRPFEMFVKMYGLPDYKELDPTVLVGITYSLLFGFMFADVGQGALIVLLGLFFSYFKKSDLGAVLARCGVFSIIFGFMFGSVFGFEDIVEPLWLRPAKAMTALPILGNLNSVFVVSILLGMGIIVFTMCLNIINKIRFKRAGEALFDANGIAGIIFYASCIGVVLLIMTGRRLPAAGLLLIVFVLPLVMMLFKEPLLKMISADKKQAAAEKAGAVMFIVQGIFELFEVLLGYFSNTLSFVRVGAFAISHAVMMEVVLMLSGYESGSPNWIVVVLGNIFVCCLEGLIVGIQVLRLDYYELFSRFYKGSGREFIPYGRSEE
jgi:putative V-type sodium ATPase, I subunit